MPLIGVGIEQLIVLYDVGHVQGLYSVNLLCCHPVEISLHWNRSKCDILDSIKLMTLLTRPGKISKSFRLSLNFN